MDERESVFEPLRMRWWACSAIVVGLGAVVREQLAPAACCIHGFRVDVCGVGVGRFFRGLVCMGVRACSVRG